jgi:hypothetical protein
MEMFRRGFEACGVSVETFLLGEDISAQERELKNLTTQHFDGIFDVNSLLPHVVLDEKYFPDYFDAPFYHMIVDHPMHLHLSLSIPLKNCRVICLDKYHKKYLEEHYPHIKKVYILPFGGITASDFTASAGEPAPMKSREMEILFPGTFTPLPYYREQMETVSDDQWEICSAILQRYRRGETKSIDEFYREELGEDVEFFPLRMHKARLIDRYIREWYRESVLKCLLKAGVKVDVMGFRWEMFSDAPVTNLRIHAPASYPEQLAMLGKSRMVLNVQPLFRDGIHDRVMNTMANRSVAVTDSCEFVQHHFSSGRELLIYEKNQPEEMSEKVIKLLGQPDVLEEMSRRAWEAFRENHTWYRRVEHFMNIM